MNIILFTGTAVLKKKETYNSFQLSPAEATSKLTMLLTTLTTGYSCSTKSGSMKINHVGQFE